MTIIQKLIVFTLISMADALACAADRLDPLLFENVNVISMENKFVAANMDVLVRDGMIADVVSHPIADAPPGVRRIDGTGHFLMPGLIDSHVHIWKDPAARVNDENAAKRLLINGVTRARVAFGEPEILPWRDAVDDGEAEGARLVVASPYITTSVETEDFILSNPDADQARASVRQFAADGYDYVKVVSVHDQETLDSILDEADVQKIPVFGHYPNASLPVDSVVKSTWVSIEHFDTLVSLLRKELGTSYDIADLVEHLKSSGAAVTTVGLLFEDDIVADSVIGSDLKQFVTLGGTLLAGTEGNFGPGGLGNTLHLELSKLESLGLSRFQVLQTATANAQKYVRKEDHAGLVKAGYAADLLLLSENPLLDLSALRSLRGVSVSGRWYGKGKLDEIRGSLPSIGAEE